MSYELLYRYTHCHREIIQVVGRVDSLDEAEAWLDGLREEISALAPPCLDATGKECPVSYCAMKIQQPARSYRNVEG